MKQIPKIPSSVKINSRNTYLIKWIETFPDASMLGECCPNTKTITLKLGRSAKETYSTFIHEVLHALSFSYSIGLTEKQVFKLEKAIKNLLKNQALF